MCKGALDTARGDYRVCFTREELRTWGLRTFTGGCIPLPAHFFPIPQVRELDTVHIPNRASEIHTCPQERAIFRHLYTEGYAELSYSRPVPQYKLTPTHPMWTLEEPVAEGEGGGWKMKALSTPLLLLPVPKPQDWPEMEVQGWWGKF